MSWTADGSALSDHTTFVRVLDEANFAIRGGNYDIPGRFGVYRPTRKYLSGSDVLLEVGLKHTDAHDHLSSLVGMFDGLTTLQRTDHPAGTVQADVEWAGAPRQTQNRFTYALPFYRVDGAWEDASVATASGTAPSITTTGDLPIGDMVITFSAPGTATLVDSEWGTATMEYSGTGTAIVDVGARTIVKGGANQDANFTATPWWFRFAPNTTVDLTSTVSLTVDYRNKWA